MLPESGNPVNGYLGVLRKRSPASDTVVPTEADRTPTYFVLENGEARCVARYTVA